MGQHHQRHLCRYIKIYLSSRWSGGRAGTPDLTRALLDRKFINVSNVCWPHPKQHFSTEPEIAYEERMAVVVPGAEEMQKRARYASKWGIGNTKKTTKLTHTWGERERREGGVEGEGCIGDIELAAYLQRANHANGRTPSVGSSSSPSSSSFLFAPRSALYFSTP